jgi:anhydro-N-acetylmuramic acid kinase
MASLAIGLMSGTSLDGIDGALIQISGSLDAPTVQTLKTLACNYPESLRQRLLIVAEGTPVPVGEISALHRDVALAFSGCALELLVGCHDPCLVIGSHGQTVHHQPPGNELGHTFQLGHGAIIAAKTGITTVSDFRSRDMAYGGQGAPLVPFFDALLLRDPKQPRCIQNLGGIGNVTFLGSEKVLAFDTGPANLLVDGAMRLLYSQPFDQGGQIALSGTVDSALLEHWLQDPYFSKYPPKSTGREYFGYARAEIFCQEASHLAPADQIATLSELTVQSLVRAYQDFLPAMPTEIFLSGGGAHNQYFIKRLATLLAPARVDTTATLGVDVDFKEAIAFAVLAWLRLHNRPTNFPSATGASKRVLLGDVHSDSFDLHS